MEKSIYALLILATVICMTNCQKRMDSVPTKGIMVNVAHTNTAFNDYWYSGKAEVASYHLEQSRYGELHKGKAVLIFVTEDFSKGKQVKLDYPYQAGEDKASVMKMNFTKKFNTGIYPYSMMLSVFTPVSLDKNPHTLKTTMSSQEWCGHVFTQLNLHQNKYRVSSHSYFESEGDKSFDIERTLLEDEIWTRLRLDYKALPTGKVTIIPGLFYSRMNHQALEAAEVICTISERADRVVYSIESEKQQRKLSITIEKQFPHQILSWEETSPGISGKTLTTKAVLDKTIRTDYWSKNKNNYSYLRDSLNLNP